MCIWLYVPCFNKAKASRICSMRVKNRIEVRNRIHEAMIFSNPARLIAPIMTVLYNVLKYPMYRDLISVAPGVSVVVVCSWYSYVKMSSNSVASSTITTLAV